MRVALYLDEDALEEPGDLAGRLLRSQGHDVIPVVRTPDLRAPEDVGLSVHMGSPSLPSDPAAAAMVDPERQIMKDAVATGVPVLGICFGAQLLAEALGGTTGPAAHPENGLMEVQSSHELCPPGPWAQHHQHAFTVPEGAVELGRSSAGPQGVLWDPPTGARALGWQFHPEVTPAVIRRWGRNSATWADLVDPVLEVLLDEKSGAAERSGRLMADGIAWLLRRERRTPVQSRERFSPVCT